jgi:hypothetical protein
MVIIMQAPARCARWLCLSLAGAGVLLTLAGCATSRATGALRRPAAKISQNNPSLILAGVWEGTSVSDCWGMTLCMGLRHITFTMLPAVTGGLDGFYRCEQSTAACESYNDRGVITGASVDQRLFSANVELRDDQTCVFRSPAAPIEMEGRFYCKQRAIEIDRGVWRAQHNF